MELKIDLQSVSDEKDVLRKLGEALGYDDSTTWGVNWDAFNDILRYIDTGGIWGTNKIFSFPIIFVISNFHTFKDQAPQKFAILEDILRDTKAKYAKENKGFDFQFME